MGTTLRSGMRRRKNAETCTLLDDSRVNSPHTWRTQPGSLCSIPAAVSEAARQKGDGLRRSGTAFAPGSARAPSRSVLLASVRVARATRVIWAAWSTQGRLLRRFRRRDLRGVYAHAAARVLKVSSFKSEVSSSDTLSGGPPTWPVIGLRLGSCRSDRFQPHPRQRVRLHVATRLALDHLTLSAAFKLTPLSHLQCRISGPSPCVLLYLALWPLVVQLQVEP